MIRKLLLKIKTSLALKKNDAIRISDAYKEAKRIGLLYSLDEKRSDVMLDDLIKKFEADKKQVNTMAFVPLAAKISDPGYAYFNEKDLNAKGNWSKESVTQFKNEPFDFLVSLDWNQNKYTQNILAKSKAKCRVGRYEEGKDQYFEMMINPNDDKYTTYLEQVYHYLTNVRNG
ncbi:hypothetical protein SAMN04488029_0437 [Reichenbachiella faecimaris]|uniref:Uncharacterized protein n=1 Tax=Reichenbachiella faecimaris TaxID=692418 RepID=A0A1W2G608_REIFA|nr:hypothetical protein [Reichenbachiella faecimaris]SMD32097.1 hypothetical protein SAMN04488029_0437 [Reichenbachiella faecimaris]